MFLKRSLTAVVMTIMLFCIASCKLRDPGEVVNDFIENITENRCSDAEEMLSSVEKKKLKIGLCNKNMPANNFFLKDYFKRFMWQVEDVKKVDGRVEVKVRAVGPFDMYDQIWSLINKDVKVSGDLNSGNVGMFYNDAFEALLDVFGRKEAERTVSVQLVKDWWGVWKIEGLDEFYDWLFGQLKVFLKISEGVDKAIDQVQREKLEDEKKLRDVLKSSIDKLDELFRQLTSVDDGMWFALPRKHEIITMVVSKKMACIETLSFMDELQLLEVKKAAIEVKVNECKELKKSKDRMKCIEDVSKKMDEELGVSSHDD
jgi:hypothetical protein